MKTKADLEPDWYEILGADASATAQEIKAVYRRKVRDHHPDYLGNVSEAVKRLAEDRLKQINAAYEVLSDATRRKAYDQRRTAAHQQHTQEEDKRDRLRRINQLWDSGRIGDALKLADELWESHPQDDHVRNVYASLLLEAALDLRQRRRTEEATKLLNQALEVVEDPSIDARIRAALDETRTPPTPAHEEPIAETKADEQPPHMPSTLSGLAHEDQGWRWTNKLGFAIVCAIILGVVILRAVLLDLDRGDSSPKATTAPEGKRGLEPVVAPPLPPPARPLYSKLVTTTVFSDALFIRHPTAWHSFRERSSSVWRTTITPRIVLKDRPIRIRVSGELRQDDILSRPTGLRLQTVLPKLEKLVVGADVVPEFHDG